MTDFFPGQRWISNTESELGLGLITAVNNRQLTLLFPASDETRLYSRDEPPITRVVFAAGDVVTSHEGWQLTIESLGKQQQLIIYHGIRRDNGQSVSLRENLLDGALVFSRPQDKLLAGYSGPVSHFMLRYYARLHYSEQYRLPWIGLTGSRTSLIPHQLHIAREVGLRHAPRVLLADEVGLGKTIEAGLIIHQQLLTGAVSRVCIVVPENLQHQWLVEMLRRFNLHFALFDDERYGETLDENHNPFETEQLVICSLDFVCASAQRRELLCLANWDLLVVDEAHHLVWHPQQPGPEYSCIEQLARQIPAVLLLTATPEQLGLDSHFARLHLLDKNRFPDLTQFLNEQQQYRPVAEAVGALLEDKPLSEQQQHGIQALVSEQDISGLLQSANGPSDDARSSGQPAPGGRPRNSAGEKSGYHTQISQRDQARQQLINLLVDRHGTSRVLFRNTRHAVAGFPRRILHPVPLPLPAAYQAALLAAVDLADEKPQQYLDVSDTEQQITALLCPEQLPLEPLPLKHSPLEHSPPKHSSPEQHPPHTRTQWYDIDPRVSWLAEYLLQHRQQKVLVICAHAGTALELEQVLRERQGIRASVFHQGMSIIERDRAAAWFADVESGAQVLICSEIGSEGRNFQFASTLVMFDLPLNPDLLEQRIGRLDRIGQQHDVQIYVPYLEHSAQAILLRWYHEGLDAFEHTSSTGRTVFEQLREPLLAQLHKATDQLEPLLAHCRQQNTALKQQLEQGRDRLLEIHSSGGEQAQQLANDIAAQDRDETLIQFCNILFDIIGVQYEELGEQLFALTPHSNMLIPDFPGLGREGCTVTYHRATALAREDVQFLSWEHPLIRNGLDLILSGDLGISSLALLKFPELPAGTLLLELIYVVEAHAAPRLQLSRFLPPTPLRLLIDKHGNNMADRIGFRRLQNRLENLNRHNVGKLVRMVHDELKTLLQLADPLAERATAGIIAQAQQQAKQTLDSEISRLQALKTVNPAIRDDEIQGLISRRDQLLATLCQARYRLDALQLIIVTE